MPSASAARSSSWYMAGTPTSTLNSPAASPASTSSAAKPEVTWALAPTASTPRVPRWWPRQWCSGSGHSTRSSPLRPRIGA
ncbi:hypothetical protein G443_001194 [Actinoalloteichus cyanogriseus DSM 43889]|uniref:Uncharacterized protein n=1 Tax=Actinoalloteichus caeruleus DSM 43889 TaxID=1120930 RepID=A0ABT1JEJ8_ACTCY|nr:hypothetical protein [Actinoalloteichus caeruleus DSM 43889]